MYVWCLDLYVCENVCGSVTGWSVIWCTVDAGSYVRDIKAVTFSNSHIKTALYHSMVKAVMLHPTAFYYSCNSVAHGHLHEDVITVILSIHSYTIINTGILTSCLISGQDSAALGHYFIMLYRKSSSRQEQDIVQRKTNKTMFNIVQFPT